MTGRAELAAHEVTMSPDVYSLGVVGRSILGGLFLLAIACVVVVAVSAHRRRRVALAAWAQAMRLSYEHSLPGGRESADIFLAQFGASGMLDGFRRVSVHNIIRGWAKGHSWLIFDLHGCSRRGGRKGYAAQLTVTVLLSAESFPTLRIEPLVPLASWLHPERCSAIATGHDEFDRRFMVFGARSSVAKGLTPALREHLLELASAPDRWYRHLLTHRNMIALVEATLAPPVHIEDMMTIAVGIREQMIRTDEGP